MAARIGTADDLAHRVTACPGNQTRLVLATDEMIAELARYSRAHGLPPTPQPGETRPLVLAVIGREKGSDKASG